MAVKRDERRRRADERHDGNAFLPPAYFVGALLVFALAVLATFL